MRDLLIQLGLSSEASIRPTENTARDNKNVNVLKCEKSGVYLVDRIEPSNIPANSQAECYDDDWRRYKFLNSRFSLRGIKMLDFGCGSGGLVRFMKEDAVDCSGYERGDYPEYKHQKFDIITMFHVLEHLEDPIGTLKELRGRLCEGGMIVIETPNANDFLLNFDECQQYIFQADHLLLHTRKSLKVFLETAGFKNISIEGVQRYPLANHLHWGFRKKPWGHVHWGHLRDDRIEKDYETLLEKYEMTDTLLAVAYV